MNMKFLSESVQILAEISHIFMLNVLLQVSCLSNQFKGPYQVESSGQPQEISSSDSLPMELHSSHRNALHLKTDWL